MQRSTSQTVASGPRAEQNCSTNAAISSAVVSSVIQSSKRVTYNIIIIFLVIYDEKGDFDQINANVTELSLPRLAWTGWEW